MSATIRTPEDAYAAGLQDGKSDPPLTEQQATAIALLLAPHIRPVQPRAA